MKRLALLAIVMATLAGCNADSNDSPECREWQETYLRNVISVPELAPFQLKNRPDGCDIPDVP